MNKLSQHSFVNFRKSFNTQRENMNEAWARTVDLPGLEDNISPNNNIKALLGCIITDVNFFNNKN